VTARIDPLAPPYDARVAEDLDKLMPPGVAPIALFRMLAKNPRVLRRIRRGGLLDPGSITLRERELIILRTTAKAGAEYEWGVHVAFFGAAAGFDAEQLHATVWGGDDAACWTDEERALVAACDELHGSARLGEETFRALRARFSEEQVIEVLALAGQYRAIACLIHGAGLDPEEGAPRFPARGE